jgi:hypothetical protein
MSVTFMRFFADERGSHQSRPRSGRSGLAAERAHAREGRGRRARTAAGALPLLLRGVVISARASFIMFCSEALGLIILSVVVLAQVSHLSAPLHPTAAPPAGCTAWLA